MNYKFGTKSIEQLDTCEHSLQKLFLEVIKRYDCSILQGHRTKSDQDFAYANKRSKVKWPNSKHNFFPSNAVDVVPSPIDWGNTGTKAERKKAINRFYHFAGYVKSTADSLGIAIKWGGDWDGDYDFSDQNFDDLPHWELINARKN